MMLLVYYLIGLFVALDAVHVVPVHLVSEANTRYRTRRDVPDESMPDRLTFQMNFLDKPVTLRLRQSELLDVTTSDPRTTLLGNQFITNSAVYTDPSLSSAVIVRRNNGQYNLAGTFNAFGYSWDIEPHEVEASTSNLQLHKIFNSPRLDKQLNLRDDAIHVEKADGPELKEATYSQQTGDKRKRAFTQHVVEIAFVLEYEEYLYWTSLYGDIEGMSRLRLWYSFVAEGINAVYQGIKDTDFSISTRVNILKVVTTREENSFLDSIIVNGTMSNAAALNAFIGWIWFDLPEFYNISIKSDHYMLFARKNLLGTGVVGTAFIGRTCSGEGASVIPSTKRELILTVAPHELGHSLGAQHDGDTNGSCSNSDKFVMVESVVDIPPVDHPANPWTFSNCSIKMIKSYLSSVQCTLPENTQAKNEFPTLEPGQRAGEILSKDEQCQLYYKNKNSKYCPDNSTVVDAVLCSKMKCCTLTSNNTCSKTCQSFRPLDYTKCDVNKVCYRDLCVAI